MASKFTESLGMDRCTRPPSCSRRSNGGPYHSGVPPRKVMLGSIASRKKHEMKKSSASAMRWWICSTSWTNSSPSFSNRQTSYVLGPLH